MSWSIDVAVRPSDSEYAVRKALRHAIEKSATNHEETDSLGWLGPRIVERILEAMRNPDTIEAFRDYLREPDRSVFYAAMWNEDEPGPDVREVLSDKPYDTLDEAKAACVNDFADILTIRPDGEVRVVSHGEYDADDDEIKWFDSEGYDA